MSNTPRPIFYDTETTGVRAEKDYIVEIAAYDPVNNLSFEKLVNPRSPIPPEATAVHKITDEMVANSPTFDVIGKEFMEFCKGDVILIAHNNDNFDIHFLRTEYARHGMAMPTEWRFLDSLKWARRYRSDLPRHSLQFLRESYGFTANNAHRALDDVIILHQVFSCMTDDIDIAVAFDLLNKPRDIQHMPFGKHQGVPLSKVPKDYLKWLCGTDAFDKPENQELKACFVKLGMLAIN